MRTLEEIDRDLEIAYADMRNFIHSGFSISPVLEDDIDELRDERAAVVKAIQDAGLMRYEVCILPKPENTSSCCLEGFLMGEYDRLSYMLGAVTGCNNAPEDLK